MYTVVILQRRGEGGGRRMEDQREGIALIFVHNYIRRASPQTTHIQVQNLKKIVLVTQSIPCLIFLMCGRTIQSLNYSGQESKNVSLIHT